eukprot:NODE_7860_length_382_cov_77.129129_g6156_i0.p2 GENE.NODE_7860_length_382_cov_77.129129_g6156_i0~~NODE_7860_length_382_cov_77.129129_g6156_i0.p2  ORF type:complete len:69 (+),score=14.25 NODE_7860_length_382_cov_77.129129_g6156_i0:24-209(+)
MGDVLQRHVHCSGKGLPPSQCPSCATLMASSAVLYQSLREMELSDHKPVFALFHIREALSV